MIEKLTKYHRYNEYEGQARRSLTFAERKVNLVNLREKMQRFAGEIDYKITTFLPLISQRNFGKKDFDNLVEICTKSQKEAFEFGKQAAAAEIEIVTPKTAASTYDVMYTQNEEELALRLEDIYTRLESKGYSEEGIVSQFLNGLKSIFVYGAINM